LDFQVQVVLPFRGECDAANSAATADARADAWLKIFWTGVMMRVMMCLGLSGCPSICSRTQQFSLSEGSEHKNWRSVLNNNWKKSSDKPRLKQGEVTRYPYQDAYFSQQRTPFKSR
jgi:hypothetical protein